MLLKHRKKLWIIEALEIITKINYNTYTRMPYSILGWNYDSYSWGI